MPTLNEIQHEIANILDSLETAEPEELQQLQESLDQYLGELATMEAEKADSIAFIIRQQVARIEMLKAEERRIKARRQSAEKQLARTKSYFQSVMEQHGLKKVQGVSSTLYLRKSEKVELNAEATYVPELYLPSEFVKTKTTHEADKSKVKKAIKNGRTVPCCELIETFSLNVR